jgi:hypothetical protein
MRGRKGKMSRWRGFIAKTAKGRVVNAVDESVLRVHSCHCHWLTWGTAIKVNPQFHVFFHSHFMNKEKRLLYVSKRGYTKPLFPLLNNASESVLAHCPRYNAPFATILPIVKSGKWRAPQFNSIERFIDKQVVDMNVRK